ncbi:formate dehydrogenase subunit delta [Albimonas pacifica]|uniref:Formate dehydrogenase delta subunit n=1 Tax=Albimonas pacifica TaxID=1114924 RepID=A0A1I3NEC3_9RHOB|nr:formate dehydrogenase subunit delta [Albimonas pacifica]SFJ07643.1 formate dehydrogenase delta subunit [Albimonas pacifica]
MKTDELVTMANQIAAYFRAYPEDEAVEGVADHIRQFWDPRMRDGLRGHLAAGGEGLDGLAKRGAERALGAA